MNVIKTAVEKPIKWIGHQRINRILNRYDVKFEIAKRGANYYGYYWKKAFKKMDLKMIPDFSEIAAQVIAEKRTFLDYDRLYTFWQAVSSLESSDLPIAEIGVYRGGSAKFILEALKKINLKNEFHVFDTFEGHAVVDELVDGPHKVGQFGETSYEEVRAYLEAPNVVIYKGDFLETARHIEHISNFGLVHIDVDVYPVTKFCLEFFSERTIPGSILIIDDYGNNYCKGLKKAVDEYTSANSQFKMIYLLTGQALMIKLR
jgi:O-methyltransferase